VAQALRQNLVQALTAEQVFMDVSDLAPGVSFSEEIHRRLHSCSILIAIIGPTWLGAANEAGERRLDDPTDLVRVEIITALENGVHVVPVLVDRTPMPKPELLPESLRRLVQLNAFPIDHHRFDPDVERLTSELLRFIRSSQPRTFQSCSEAWEVEAAEKSSSHDKFCALDYLIDNETNEELRKIALYNRGISLLEKRQCEQAVVDFTNSIRRFHWRSLTDDAYAKRDQACRLLDALPDAIAACTDEIGFWPGSYCAFYYRAGAWATTGQSDKAVSDYERAILALPDGVQSFRSPPDEQCWQRALNNVLTNLLRELARVPDNSATAVSIGRAFEVRGNTSDIENAIKYYRLAIKNERKRAIGQKDKVTFATARDALKRLGAPQDP
jgi:tetratricopeptide (TPR) repeat protein